jgi:dienelactone hydrolase
MAVAVLLTLMGAACGGGGGESGDSADRSTPVGPVSRPSLAIEDHAEAFVDTSRTTNPVGNTPAAPARSLPTAIIAPATGQPGRPYPLIVFGHGSGGRGRADHQLLRKWASAGYVVAAPTFPFGGGRAVEGTGQAADDLANQPADMSFVITEMLRLNGEAAGPLAGAIDPTRIGAAGHSLGGMTTLALAGNTCCHDDRVDAAVVLAGREMPFPQGQFWFRIRTPLLLVHGEDDGVVPYADGRRAYTNAPPPRFLVTIIAGDHGKPFTGSPDDAQAQVVTNASLDFFDHYLRGVAGRLDRLKADATVQGVARLESEV